MSAPTKTFSILAAVARNQPDATAIVHQDKNLSYGDLFDAASSFAAKLAEAGLPSKSVVGLIGSKNIEFVLVFLALLHRGNPVVPLSPALRSAEIIELAERLSLIAVCYSEKFSCSLKQGLSAAEVLKLFTWPGVAAVEMIKLRQGGIIDDRQAELARLGISSIRLSSGTTGRSKGIMISEDAIWWRAECNSVMHQVTSDDCIIYLVAMDLASPHLIAYFANGATVVVEEAHNFDAIRRICANHRVTHVHATPLFYQMITTQPGLSRSDFPCIKYFISTGAPLPAAVADGFHEKFGSEITQYYGLGECGPVFVNVSNESSKRGAAGVLLPGWEISFTGRNGSDSSDIGELLVRGPGLFHGYYDPWQLAKDVLVDGWFSTGDLVRCDQDGYYWIGGRSKALINVGGTKVFPWEIENILMTHPDVEEALVYGQRDARFGEVPHAKVKARNAAAISERELLRYVNERVSILKNLRKVEFVSALPRTNTGKLKRWE